MALGPLVQVMPSDLRKICSVEDEAYEEMDTYVVSLI